MKKYIAAAMTALLCAAAFMTGCGSKSDDSLLYDYDLSKYVELGQYKGLEVPLPDTEVTDEEVETEIVTRLEDAGEFTELDSGVVEKWDVANINFVGTMDGEAFDGGSGDNYELKIGSGQFVPGFEDKLIGAEIGGTTVIDLTFPADYYEELAGKDVEFTVTINSVKRTALTVEFVQANSDCATIEEYEDSVRGDLAAKKASDAQQSQESALWQQVMNNCTILDYPKKEVDQYIKDRTQAIKDYAKQQNKPWKDFLEQDAQMTQSDFDSYVDNEAHDQIGWEMVLCAIARQEGLEPTEDEYNDSVNRYMSNMGYESEQAFRDASDGKSLEESVGRKNIEMNIIYENVLEFIKENAVET